MFQRNKTNLYCHCHFNVDNTESNAYKTWQFDFIFDNEMIYVIYRLDSELKSLCLPPRDPDCHFEALNQTYYVSTFSLEDGSILEQSWTPSYVPFIGLFIGHTHVAALKKTTQI